MHQIVPPQESAQWILIIFHLNKSGRTTALGATCLQLVQRCKGLSVCKVSEGDIAPIQPGCLRRLRQRMTGEIMARKYGEDRRGPTAVVDMFLY